MADPTVQSFCCRRPPPQQHMLMGVESLIHEFSSKPYLITTLCSSTIGMVGALYQILIRYLLNRDGDFRLYYLQTMRYFRVPNRLLAQRVGKKIVVWLAVADFFASGCVFVRASFWIYATKPTVLVGSSSAPSDDARIIFCAVISSLIQYFYTCTWLWTICYALNIRAYLRDEVIEERRYHFYVWPIAALLTAIGTTVLYYPNADCHSFNDLYSVLTRVLPNYCATYLPIVLVMLVNPILYHSAANNIDMDQANGTSNYTTTERSINATLKWKFLMINIVFYICWLPNLICGVTLWTSWHRLPQKLMLSIWYLMAIVNPLQAFFNTLVYRKWQASPNATNITNTTTTTTTTTTYPQDSSGLLQRVFRTATRANPGGGGLLGERAPLLQPATSFNKASAPPPPTFHQL